MWMTLVPLVWLATVTLSAGWIKISDPSPKIGFIARAHEITAQLDADAAAKTAATPPAADAKPLLTEKQVANLTHVRFNQYLNCTLCAVFMAVIVAMLALCAWEAGLLLSGRKPLVSSETSPLPAVAGSDAA
jgi:carbon starvation protein